MKKILLPLGLSVGEVNCTDCIHQKICLVTLAKLRDLLADIGVKKWTFKVTECVNFMMKELIER